MPPPALTVPVEDPQPRAGSKEAPAERPIRLALFTGNYHHIADGVSLTLNRLVRYLEAQGHAVLVFGPTVKNPPLAHAGTFVPVPSISAPGRPEYRISTGFSRAARKHLEAFAPDLVQIATPDVLGHRALSWANARGVPVVASYHTHFVSYLDYYRLGVLEGALWAYTRRFYNQCAQVYVPSWSMAEVLQAHGVTAPMRLWARGVETERFTPEHRSSEWRQKQGFGPDEPVLAYVSRLVWEKSPDVFAAVVEGLEARGLAHGSLIVGDGPARADLGARLPRTVFTGHLSGDALAMAYASADVFVFPSDSETFGNVTLEAMASGLPTVCADAPGSRGLVRLGETGFLCPARDDSAFAEATASLVSDAALRARMGTAAREVALGYSWPTILERLVGFYREVLSVPASRPLS